MARVQEFFPLINTFRCIPGTAPTTTPTTQPPTTTTNSPSAGTGLNGEFTSRGKKFFVSSSDFTQPEFQTYSLYRALLPTKTPSILLVRDCFHFFQGSDLTRWLANQALLISDFGAVTPENSMKVRAYLRTNEYVLTQKIVGRHGT